MLNHLGLLSYSKTAIALFFTILLAFAVQPAYSSNFSYDTTTEDKAAATQDSSMSETDEYGEASGDYGTEAQQHDTSSLQSEIPGVGAFFGKMLDSLTSVTNSSEGQMKGLAASLPLVFPDLYKVFITL